MLLTLVVVSTFGYVAGTVVSVLLFIAALITTILSLIDYIRQKQKRLVIWTVSIFLCAISALNLSSQMKTDECLAASYDDLDGYVCGVVSDVPGYDGTYRYVIRSDDGFEFMLNTSEDMRADIYDRFEGNVDFCTSAPNSLQPTVQAYARSTDVRFYKTEKSGLKGLVRTAREFAVQYIDSNIAGQTGALVKGLLLGDSSSLSVGLERDFTITGLAHMLVISGAHLSILVAVLILILPLGMARRRFAWIVLIPMVFYMLLCGMGPSVVRAGICSTVFVLSYTFKRDADPVNSLGVSAMLTGLFWPQGAISIGFLLSFFSTLGAVLLYSPINRLIQKTGLPKLLKIILKPVVLTLTAQLFIIPITLNCYGELTPCVVLSNLLVGWIVGVVIIVGAAMVLLAALMLTQPLAWLMANLIKWIATLCIFLVGTVSDIGISSVPVPVGVTLVILGVIYLGGILIAGANNRKRVSTVGLSVLITGVLLLSASTYLATERVHVVAVTKDCTVIRYKSFTVTVGECTSPKERMWLTSYICDSGEKHTDVYTAHSHQRAVAEGMITTLTPRIAAIPKCDIEAKATVYETEKGEVTFTTDEGFSFRVGDGYTFVDFNGIGVAVADEGADLSHIKGIHCVMARGECLVNAKSAVKYDDLNVLAIGECKVYNSKDEKYHLSVDKCLGVIY